MVAFAVTSPGHMSNSSDQRISTRRPLLSYTLSLPGLPDILFCVRLGSGVRIDIPLYLIFFDNQLS